MSKLNAYDVSSYNSGINNAITDGEAVIVKATEGTGYVNPAMHNQIETTKKGGKLLGLYHFARAGNVEHEANYFLRMAKPYLKDTILVLDYEGASVSAGGTTWAKKWLEYVYKQTGTKPLLYLGLADENRFNWSGSGISSQYNLWFAQYDTMEVWHGFNPNKKLVYGKINHWKNDKIAMYQYTANGRIKGYNAPLDLDVYYGTKDDWVGHSNNNTKGDVEMSWHPLVKATQVGSFLITKAGKTTTVWDSPDVTKRKDTGLRLAYGATYEIFDSKDAFFKVGKKQWIDSATGVNKQNKLAFNHKAKCTCIVTAKTTRGYADTTSGKATGRTFKKGEKYIVHGYNNGYVLVGAGKDRYLSEKDIRLIL